MVVLNEILAGSSPSSSTHDHNHRYDVFLSFRGVDTRNNFTDYLYNALLDAAINTFLDDEEIETGEPLKPELEGAIKSSRASIIVLSKNYASSTWCLDELVLILEQKRKFNQIVIPIFYHVEPTDVRKQQNSFGEAMEKHKQRMEGETNEEKRSELAQKMELWKMALTQVANLKGKDATGRKESELIEEVVINIHRRLGVLLSNTMPLLIGMDDYILRISSWLTNGSHHSVDTLTIVGMGGIGKTTLAKYMFQVHSSDFHKSSFIEGINTRCSERFNGLLDLQKQLHGDISKRNKLQVNDVSVYTTKIEKALARKRVFIVLDDIGSLKQLDALLGNKGLHPGSKIIVTTKDASLTERCALFNTQVQPKNMKVSLNGLYTYESLELLCIHAFKSHKPEKGYEEVSEKLVCYCEGHPLALQVLGSALYKQGVAHWEACIERLKKEPHPDIKTSFQVSIDLLPSENDKELFKHIACFFVGEDRGLTKTVLNACDIETKFGINILINRCLLSIGWNNEFTMHSLIQEMGRDLVRQESPQILWKRSRLWCHEESFKVLKKKKGKGNLLGLSLDTRMLDKKKLSKSLELETEAFTKMDNLMLLQLNYVQLNGCFEKFPEELRWLCMRGSPLKSIPSDLPMDNLVALDMSYSNIESFDMSCSNPQPPTKRQKGLIGSSSKDKRLLGSLKILDLSFCEQLHSVCGFYLLPALKKLIVKNCTNLIEVCESVEQCDELAHIDLSYCCKLSNLPIIIGKLKKVKALLLDGFNSRESQIEAIPSDLKLITYSFPSSLTMLSLANNNMSNECFPVDFSCLAMLEELYLDYNPIVSIPNCVNTLPRLEVLYMDFCEMLISIENPPHTLRELSVYSYRTFHTVAKSSLMKIKFAPEMSPLKLLGVDRLLSPFEIDGMVKIQSIASVEEKVLHSLGWTNINSIKERHMRVYKDVVGESIECQTQMYYELGIFSTIYEGKEMPDFISHRSKGSSISFTIPSCPKKLRGMNFCCAETHPFDLIELPMIRVSNITKNLTWIYKHYIHYVQIGGLSEYNTYKRYRNKVKLERKYCLLSHWMFGPNEMKAGDHITITVGQKYTTECGIGLVYEDDDGTTEEEEEDVLGYYKSWNHIIGGDLFAFQLTTGEYILDSKQFTRLSPTTYTDYHPFIGIEGSFKEEGVAFKAFF